MNLPKDRPPLRIKMSDLPIAMELEGPNGETRPYIIAPAGRKRIGASLQAVSDRAIRAYRKFRDR